MTQFVRNRWIGEWRIVGGNGLGIIFIHFILSSAWKCLTSWGHLRSTIREVKQGTFLTTRISAQAGSQSSRYRWRVMASAVLVWNTVWGIFFKLCLKWRMPVNDSVNEVSRSWFQTKTAVPMHHSLSLTAQLLPSYTCRQKRRLVKLSIDKPRYYTLGEKWNEDEDDKTGVNLFGDYIHLNQSTPDVMRSSLWYIRWDTLRL